METQIDQQLVNRIRLVWPFLKTVLLKAGITFSMVVAAVHLIPDTAVMSKDEIENKTVLPEKELYLRKAVIPGIIMTGCAIPKNIKYVFTMSRNPGIQSKLLAFSRILVMTPAFLLAYNILKRRLDQQEPTLNIRELTKDSPISPKAQAAISTAGLALHGGTIGVSAALQDMAAAKATSVI